MRITENVEIGTGKMVLFAGPCAVESYDLCIEVGTKVKEICDLLGLQYVFKASFDKANRTSIKSFRGSKDSLKILERVKNTLKVPVITDVHEAHQCTEVATIADVLQIPAFLCRQTDLIVSAAFTAKPVMIKKGQFMKPEDMAYAVEKVMSTGNHKAILTERGSSFGYNNLVVDFRSIQIMKQFAPVVFDATHSTTRQFSNDLAKAAVAIGIDGLFIETHPNPSQALSDKENMIPLNELEDFLIKLKIVN